MSKQKAVLAGMITLAVVVLIVAYWVIAICVAKHIAGGG